MRRWSRRCRPGSSTSATRCPASPGGRAARGFSYRDPSGGRCRDGRSGPRFRRPRHSAGVARRLGFAPTRRASPQATGVDAAGRKQYRYHPAWGAWRGAGEVRPGSPRSAARSRGSAPDRTRPREGDPGELEFSLAAIAVLLDRLHLRVGSAATPRATDTYGATTLLNRHLRLGDGRVRLRFRARAADRRAYDARQAAAPDLRGDPRPAGPQLFTWSATRRGPRRSARSTSTPISPRCTGVQGVSAKTFRTWAGSLRPSPRPAGRRGGWPCARWRGGGRAAAQHAGDRRSAYVHLRCSTSRRSTARHEPRGSPRCARRGRTASMSRSGA